MILELLAWAIVGLAGLCALVVPAAMVVEEWEFLAFFAGLITLAGIVVWAFYTTGLVSP